MFSRMNGPCQKPNEAQPLFDTLHLDGSWRATVLLRFRDPAGLLPQPCPDLTRADWLKVLTNPAQLFQPGPNAHLLHDGRSSRVLKRRLQLGNVQLDVFAKQSRRRNLLRKAVGLLRRTRPSRNWKMGWSLLTAGIPTALPLAVVEKRVAGLRIVSGIVTRSLLPGHTLEEFIRQKAAQMSLAEFRHLTTDLADLFARLYKHDFFHRDLKGKNIFVHLDRANHPRLYLLDLDGCRTDGRDYLKRVKSLARLARASLNWPIVTRSARLRFLKAYLQSSQTSVSQWKTWWRSIDRQVLLKLPSQDIV